MHLRKQTAKPHKNNIQLSAYDVCPFCGGPKRDVSKHCQKCYWISRKSTVPTDKVFYIKGKPCRYIPLTKGQSAIVSAHRYKELIQWHWYALKRRFGGYYAARTEQGTHDSVYMHRQIIGGDSPEIDHKNRNGLDNRDDNLRPCTHGQNKANKERKKNSISGFKGVSRQNCKSVRWFAVIGVQCRHITLGSFSSIEDAARAYDRAAIRYYGEFARTNFPLSDYADTPSTSSLRS